MAITAKWFGNAFISAFNKEIDFQGGTIKCALFTDASAPDQDVDQYYETATADMTEVASSIFYDTGGATIDSPAVTYTAGTNVVKFDGENPEWNAATFEARYAIIYDDAPVSSKPLISFVDFGETVSVTSGLFTIIFDEDGIATITVA